MVALTHGCQTHVGRMRAENQDAYGIAPPTLGNLNTPKGVLFVVADGMGGHRAGRQASELAVSAVIASYTAAADAPIAELLRGAFREANARITAKGDAHAAFRGMGTTCSVLVLQGSSAWTGHIGDSKIFVASSREIRQITTDHSRVWELHQKGVITREQMRTHPDRNLLTRVLGMRESVEPEITGPFPLSPGTRFILCSDGLTNHVGDEEIGSIAITHAPQEAADALVEAANARGGTDNVTVLIVGIEEDPAGEVNRR